GRRGRHFLALRAPVRQLGELGAEGRDGVRLVDGAAVVPAGTGGARAASGALSSRAGQGGGRDGVGHSLHGGGAAQAGTGQSQLGRAGWAHRHLRDRGARAAQGARLFRLGDGPHQHQPGPLEPLAHSGAGRRPPLVLFGRRHHAAYAAHARAGDPAHLRHGGAAVLDGRGLQERRAEALGPPARRLARRPGGPGRLVSERRAGVASARQVAVSALLRVTQDQAYAAAVLAQALDALPSAAERALATELCYGVLRAERYLQRRLERHADLGRTDAEVLAVLLLGAYQLEFLDRIPAHAAV